MIRVTRLVTLALAALVASGCGAYPGSTDVGVKGERPGLFGFLGGKGHHAGKAGFGGKSGHGGGFGHGGKTGPGAKGGFGLPGLPLLGVELTEEQRVALQAIAEKYRPAAAAKPDPAALDAQRAAAQARHDALKAALTAEPFDAAALRAALTPAEDAAPAKPKPDPQFLVEARAVLTDAQRATAVAKLKALPAKPERPAGAKPAHADKLATHLGLSADQQAKLAAIAAAKPAEDPDAHRQALITFLETGDAAGLTAAPARPQPPVDAIVDFVGSLDAAQRAKLDGTFLLGKGGFGGHKGGYGHKGRH